MAGEPSLFLVYKDFNSTERTGVSWHGTQARGRCSDLNLSRRGLHRSPRRDHGASTLYDLD